MKKVNIEIKLYQFNELSDEAKSYAIEEHYSFLHNLGMEVELADGRMATEEYRPSTNEVIENIEINEYYFYESGELAETVKYTGKHPLSGKTFYIFQGNEIEI